MKNILIQVNKNGMGSGNDELGLKLITNYFSLLSEEEQLPKFIVFYNEGVKLLCANSPIIDILTKLEEKGVKLIACKTCLSFYDLLGKTETGITGTMLDIIMLQKKADKVITL